MTANEPISANDAYQGTGSNEELWPILASHGAVSDPSDVRDSYLATVLINWRNAACKDVADQYHEQRDCAEKAKAELAQVRESLELSEAQLVEVSLERAEWRKQAQTHETVAKILRADLATANKRAEEQAKAHDHWLSYSGNLENRMADSRNALTVAAELIGRLAEDDECDYDHNDCCQSHHANPRPCPHPLGRQFVAAWRAVEAEQQEASGDA